MTDKQTEVTAAPSELFTLLIVMFSDSVCFLTHINLKPIQSSNISCIEKNLLKMYKFVLIVAILAVTFDISSKFYCES